MSRKKAYCDVPRCHEKAYAEMYNFKKQTWSYVCKKHYYLSIMRHYRSKNFAYAILDKEGYEDIFMEEDD